MASPEQALSPSLVPIEPLPGMHVVESLVGLTPELLGAWSHEWAPR